MGWGLLAGLGEGIGRSAGLPEQYYQNRRRELLENSQLQSEALRNALSMASGMGEAEKHPLELQSLQEALETEALRRKGIEYGMGKDLVSVYEGGRGTVSEEGRGILGRTGMGGVMSPDGTIPLRPHELTENDLRRKQIEAQIRAANAETSLTPARQKVLEAQATANGNRGLGGGRGSRAAELVRAASGMPGVEAAQKELAAFYASPRAMSPKYASHGTSLKQAVNARMLESIQAILRLEGSDPASPEFQKIIEDVSLFLALSNAEGAARIGPPGGSPDNFVLEP